MKMTGHKTDSVFRRYDIVSEGDLRDAAPKLDAGFAAKSWLGEAGCSRLQLSLVFHIGRPDQACSS